MGTIHISKTDSMNEDYFLGTLQELSKKKLCKKCTEKMREFDKEEFDRIMKELEVEFI